MTGECRLTYQDWLACPDDGRLYELLEGELHETPPPSIEHQRLSRDLGYALLTYLRAHGRGEVLYAPVGVKLGDDTVLEPDLVLVLGEHLEQIKTQAIEGAPDLVVEILSPGTARRDLGPKRQAYEQAGVTEYWIVDPEAHSIEVLVLRDSTYERAHVYGSEDRLLSPVLPGLEIDLSAIFRR